MEKGKLPVPFTSRSFAARTCCPSPACGWCVPALWQSRPAARTLWHAARSCPEEPPAALTSTGNKRIHIFSANKNAQLQVKFQQSLRSLKLEAFNCHLNLAFIYFLQHIYRIYHCNLTSRATKHLLYSFTPYCMISFSRWTSPVSRKFLTKDKHVSCARWVFPPNLI